ncbi:uncharacterized protein LOC113671628 [Pocillopora damicornis]|uniref:uncharacterized protein LOC113671628 n=1 Tax=Pocillopora damicornis TaxID=46731 RepID=UPI000F557E3E|nr:uncharacterized protein LOC113671628 [Pocillopora damicornis]
MPLNILRGLFRGATRRVMTGKMGNKNFYKGRGVRNARESSCRNATLSLARVFLLISRAPALKTTALRRPKKKNKNKKQYSFNRLAYFLPHQLKPYVSMKAPKTTSPELTAEDLLKNIKENIHLIKYREIP